MSLQDARLKIEAWRGFYNEERPHGTLDWQTPKAFTLKNGSKTQSSEQQGTGFTNL